MTRYATANFEAHFSADSVFYAPFGIITISPQLVNTPSNFITDTANWVSFNGTFIAQDGERFVILGNFNDSTQSVDTVYQYYGSNTHREVAY